MFLYNKMKKLATPPNLCRANLKVTRVANLVNQRGPICRSDGAPYQSNSWCSFCWFINISCLQFMQNVNWQFWFVGFFLKKAMISREKSILAPICWNAKILESIDQIWFHATFFSVLVFLFGIYGEFTHITINLFQSLKCLRTWKHMKDFSVMKASQFIEIDWWCWWIKSAYNRYT